MTGSCGTRSHNPLLFADYYRRPLASVIMQSFKTAAGNNPAAYCSMEGVMLEGVAPLEAGKVRADHLDILIEGTGIAGEKVIKALHEYLVDGQPAAIAYEKHGVAKAHFYSRLKVVQKSHTYAARVSRFYTTQTVNIVCAIGKTDSV